MSIKGMEKLDRPQSQHEKTRAKVNELLAAGNTEEAIDELQRYAQEVKDEELDQQCIIQSGRYASAQRQKNNGTISVEQWNISESQVRVAVADLLKKIKPAQ